MKKLIITGSILIVLAVAGGVAYYFLNYHPTQQLTIVFKQPNVIGAIYKHGTDTHEGEDDQEVRKVQSNETVSLEKGAYYVRPQGANVSDDPVDFTLADTPVTLEIDPKFSTDFLSEQLKGEKAAITAALTTKYPKLIPQYTLGQGALLEQGDWYGTTLKLKSDTEETRDIYRVVLHKVAGIWQVVGKVDLVLTSSNYPDVPVEALQAINRLNAD